MELSKYRNGQVIPYGPKDWSDYKNRLSQEIPQRALSTEDMLRDPESAQFVKNYAEKNFVDGQTSMELRSKGITYKFATLTYDFGGDTKLFPIVNEKVNDKVEIRTVEVAPKAVIIS